MKRNARIVLFGEDVADASHESAERPEGQKGGVFGVTGACRSSSAASAC